MLIAEIIQIIKLISETFGNNKNYIKTRFNNKGYKISELLHETTVKSVKEQEWKVEKQVQS